MLKSHLDIIKLLLYLRIFIQYNKFSKIILN